MAGYAEEHGVPWVAIIGSVLVTSGLAVGICAAAPSLRRLVSWYAWLRPITPLIQGAALVGILRNLASVLALVRTWPVWVIQMLAAVGLTTGIAISAFATLLVAALIAIALLVDSLAELEDDIRKAEAFIVTIDEICAQISDTFER